MLAPWAIEEMKEAKLKDKRLNKRLTQILSDLGDRPTASIPAACGGHKETVAAYRFFDNDSVDYQGVLQPHFASTRARLAEQQVVLLVQDTTELDLTRPQQQVVGTGSLDNSQRRGAFVHLLEGFSIDGTPLGAVSVDMWARKEEDADLTPAEKKRKRRETPIEEKESFRWLQGLRQARAVAQELPDANCVCIADSEGDIYELLAEPRGERPVHWLIRACHADRLVLPATSPSATSSSATDTDEAQQAQENVEITRYLQDRVMSTPVVFTKEIAVRGRDAKVACDKRARRQPRQSRTAEVEVRATTVTLKPPHRSPKAGPPLPPVTVNAVLVREINPPPDDTPVEWLLLTTLPIGTAEQVREIVQYYSVRFLIEVFFRVLKSGCRVEERRFENLERLLPCAAVYLIAAWRTLMLCRLGRSCPELNCEAVFEPGEWKAVWMVTQGKTLPDTPPPLATMIKLIAQLGGYVNRPNREDPPGPQTVWLGLQRMRDLAWAWDTFGPDTTAPKKGKKKLV